MLRHAAATHFRARITFDRMLARLNFHDDGRGFDVAARPEGFGLRGMRERVQRMGGELLIRSEAKSGCAIAITVPLKGVE